MPDWLGSLVVSMALALGLTLLHEGAIRFFKIRKGAVVTRLAILTLLVRMLVSVLSSPDLLGPDHAITRPSVAQALNGFLALWILTLAVMLLEPLVIRHFISREKQEQIPGIFRDIIRAFLMIIVIMFVLKTGFDVELGALLTTSAILSAVLGFALKDTLGNILAGIAIFVEKPFEVGDWVNAEDEEGIVDQMSWRATRIRTRNNDYMIIPNSAIANGKLVNFTKPKRLHREHFYIGVSYKAPPNKVKSVLLQVVSDAARQGITMNPAPEVLLLSYDDFSIEYDVRFWIRDYAKKEFIQDAIRAKVWYYFRRYGIEIPFPIKNVMLRTISRKTEAEQEERDRRELLVALQHVPVLEPLDDLDMGRLMEEVEVQRFAAGENLVQQGESGDSFFIILKGMVSICIKDDSGNDVQVGSLSRHDHFGEMSLLQGEKRNATVRATEDCSVAVIYRDAFKHVIEANESILDKLTDLVQERVEENRIKLAASGVKPHELPPKQERSHTRASIQRVMGFLTRKGSRGNVGDTTNESPRRRQSE